MRCDVPVVLQIRLHNLVSEVVLGSTIDLLELGDSSGQQVSESVTCAHGCVGAVERQEALNAAKAALFVLLGDGDIRAKLQGVLADDLSHVVAEGVSWVRVVPRNVSLVFLEGPAIGLGIASDFKSRQLAAEIGKQSGHGHAGRPRHCTWPRVVEEDVVGGVARHELIQQRRIESRRQPGHGTCAWTYEIRLDRGKTAAVWTAPKSGCGYGAPRIVDVADREPFVGIEVMIDAHQFLAPMSGLGRRRIKAGDDSSRAARTWRISNRYLRQQRLGVGIDGNRSQGAIKLRAGPRIRRTIL